MRIIEDLSDSRCGICHTAKRGFHTFMVTELRVSLHPLGRRFWGAVHERMTAPLSFRRPKSTRQKRRKRRSVRDSLPVCPGEEL